MGWGERACLFVTHHFVLHTLCGCMPCSCGRRVLNNKVFSRGKATVAPSSLPFSTFLLINKRSQQCVGLLCPRYQGNMTVQLLIRGLAGRQGWHLKAEIIFTVKLRVLLGSNLLKMKKVIKVSLEDLTSYLCIFLQFCTLFFLQNPPYPLFSYSDFIP